MTKSLLSLRHQNPALTDPLFDAASDADVSEELLGMFGGTVWGPPENVEKLRLVVQKIARFVCGPPDSRGLSVRRRFEKMTDILHTYTVEGNCMFAKCVSSERAHRKKGTVWTPGADTEMGTNSEEVQQPLQTAPGCRLCETEDMDGLLSVLAFSDADMWVMLNHEEAEMYVFQSSSYYSRISICYQKNRIHMANLAVEKSDQTVYTRTKGKACESDKCPANKIGYLCGDKAPAHVGYFARQMRASDEGETKFYKCFECQHRWREND